MRAERVHVAWLKQQPRHTVFDQIRHAAHVRRDGRAVHPRALGKRIRERFGQRRERVHIQRVIKAVHIGLPAREHIASRRAGVLRKRFQLGALLAVARDDEADIVCRRCAFAERADERADVLYRRQPRRDAVYHSVFGQAQPQCRAVFLPRFCGHTRRKIDTIINREHRLRVKAARDEKLRHRVGYADMIVKQPQRDGVDRAVGQPVEGSSEVVQPVVAVHRRHDGYMNFPAQNRARHVRS